MIPKEEIDRIKSDVDLKKIVESFGIELKPAGKNWIACCPFHTEKTPSFVVHHGNTHWKCYGCGESGNAIDFVMKKMGCDFMEAVKHIANEMNFTLTEDYQETPEQRRVREVKTKMVDINKMAVRWFQEQLEKNEQVQKYITDRGWDDDTVKQWQIGFAPDSYNGLFDYLRKEKKVPYEMLTKNALFKKGKKGGYYCLFRDRVMFPILNTAGDPVGFSGRLVPWHKKKSEKDENGKEKEIEEAKYVNTAGDESNENNVYTKGDILFGWKFARPSAVHEDEVVLVEGNADTIKMHQLGVENVVAACGTALTKNQAELIAKSVRKVVLLYDSDSAGIKATDGNGRKLLEAGVMVYTLTIPDLVNKETGEVTKQDPDSFFESAEHFKEFAKGKESWFVYAAKAKKAELGETPDPAEVTMFAEELAKLLLKREEGERMGHVDQLAKIMPPKKVWTAALKQGAKKQTREVNEMGYTKEQVEMIENYSFCEKGNRYCIQRDLEGGYRYVSNFTLKPLFHIEDTEDSKRLYRMTNIRGDVKDLETPIEELVSLVSFQKKIESKGNFLFWGSLSDLMLIKSYLYEKTKTCKEIGQLGWQYDGFWAWSNGVLDEQSEFQTTDELGTVEVRGKWYYLPALSSFHRNDITLFQFERKFIHTSNDADIFTLASKMWKVYGDNAVVGLGFYMATLFRDLIFPKFNSFPILNIFGERSSGKTEMAITLMKLFGQQGSGPNMNTSTIPALADHLSHCRNALVHIDEYKNSVEYEKIEILKGAYDGSGRIRMNINLKKKEMVRVDCGIILTGQESTTADNALFTRVIYLTVKKKIHTDEETAAYKDLKSYEREGLTNITNELLALREYVAENWESQLKEVREELSQAVTSKKIEDRIMNSWTIVLATLRTIGNKVKLPWNQTEAVSIFAEKIVEQQESVRENNAVAQFWTTIETLLTNGDIELGYDLRVCRDLEGLKTDYTDGKEKNKTWEEPHDVLFVNTSRIFSAYAKQVRATQDNKAQTADKSSIRHIITAQGEYMGSGVQRFLVPMKNRQNPSEGTHYNMQGEKVTAPSKSCRTLYFDYKKLKEEYFIDLEIDTRSVLEDEGDTIERPY